MNPCQFGYSHYTYCTQLVGRGEGEGEDSNCNWTLGDSETLHTQVSAVSKIDSSNISKTGVEEH